MSSIRPEYDKASTIIDSILATNTKAWSDFTDILGLNYHTSDRYALYSSIQSIVSEWPTEIAVPHQSMLFEELELKSSIVNSGAKATCAATGTATGGGKSENAAPTSGVYKTGAMVGAFAAAIVVL